MFLTLCWFFHFVFFEFSLFSFRFVLVVYSNTIQSLLAIISAMSKLRIEFADRSRFVPSFKLYRFYSLKFCLNTVKPVVYTTTLGILKSGFFQSKMLLNLVWPGSDWPLSTGARSSEVLFKTGLTVYCRINNNIFTWHIKSWIKFLIFCFLIFENCEFSFLITSTLSLARLKEKNLFLMLMS